MTGEAERPGTEKTRQLVNGGEAGREHELNRATTNRTCTIIKSLKCCFQQLFYQCNKSVFVFLAYRAFITDSTSCNSGFEMWRNVFKRAQRNQQLYSKCCVTTRPLGVGKNLGDNEINIGLLNHLIVLHKMFAVISWSLFAHVQSQTTSLQVSSVSGEGAAAANSLCTCKLHLCGPEDWKFFWKMLLLCS